MNPRELLNAARRAMDESPSNQTIEAVVSRLGDVAYSVDDDNCHAFSRFASEIASEVYNHRMHPAVGARLVDSAVKECLAAEYRYRS